MVAFGKKVGMAAVWRCAAARGSANRGTVGVQSFSFGLESKSSTTDTRNQRINIFKIIMLSTIFIPKIRFFRVSVVLGGDTIWQ